MVSGLIGPGTKVANLKEGLDASGARVRTIAQRVANASSPDFQAALQRAQGQEEGPVDSTALLETEMANLASEQIRFEMTARLLQGSFKGLRNAIQEP